MSTELTFEVTVHLNFDDGEWLHSVDEATTRAETILLNIHNIGETIESTLYDEYGRSVVTVSARYTGSKEE